MHPKRRYSYPSPSAIRGVNDVRLFSAQVGAGGILSKTLGISGHSGPVTCVDWLQARRSLSTCLTGSLDKSVKVTNLLKNDIVL